MLEKLGGRIAKHRAARGWTQQALADRIAVSRTAISHFEMDMAVPSERTVVLLAGVFRCEPHELVADTYYPPAKAARLPFVAARYTEVEKELCLLDRDFAWLERLGDHNIHDSQSIYQAWLDRLITLHQITDDAHERTLIEQALQHVREVQNVKRSK